MKQATFGVELIADLGDTPHQPGCVLFVSALCLLGDSQSAQKLMTELSSLGYRDTQFVQLTVATPCHEFWLSASRD